jgi:hypothetical protein
LPQEVKDLLPLPPKKSPPKEKSLRKPLDQVIEHPHPKETEIEAAAVVLKSHIAQVGGETRGLPVKWTDPGREAARTETERGGEALQPKTVHTREEKRKRGVLKGHQNQKDHRPATAASCRGVPGNPHTPDSTVRGGVGVATCRFLTTLGGRNRRTKGR